MELKSGSLLQGGRYRVEKTLGQGGFGITYLGTQIYLGRKVAIKEFFMDGFCMRDTSSYVTAPTDVNKGLVESFRRKFIKEAQNIAKLKHPNIVSIIDVFEDNGTAYYVMESLDGGSLADKVADGPLGEENALKYVRQVASALEYIHSNNMMHLDIKPANILLDSNDNAVVIDFGLAKQYDNTGQQTSTTPVGISHGYAPIEQYSKNGVGTFSPSTDIYSLGATLYKLVTGATPPEANHIYDEGLPPLPSYITPATCNAIEKAMQPRRKDRPQSVQEFLAILQGDVVPAVAAVSEHEAATFVPVEKTVSVQPQAGAGRSSDVESLVHSEPSLSPNSNVANGEKKKKGSLLWLWILLPSVSVTLLIVGLIVIPGGSDKEVPVVEVEYAVPEIPTVPAETYAADDSVVEIEEPVYVAPVVPDEKKIPESPRVAAPVEEPAAEPVVADEAPVEKPAAKPAAKKSSGMKLVPVTSEPKKGDTPASGKKSSPRTQKVLHIKSNQSYTIE